MTAPATLRARLSAPGIAAAPGAFDAYSARVVEDLGFPAVYLGGNAIGLQLAKGQPFIDARDMAEAICRVRAAIGIPIVADAAAGFGDAAHAARAVRELESAGANALHIDDQVHPKRAHYHLGRGRLAPREAVTAKLDAAVAARRSDELLVIARTDALRVTGSLDAALERARAYARTGIDALLVLDAGPAHAAAIAAAVPGLPLVWISGPQTAPPSLAALEAAGFSMALYPFQASVAVTAALIDTWSALAGQGRPAAPGRPAKELLDTALRLVDMPASWEIERRTVEPPDTGS